MSRCPERVRSGRIYVPVCRKPSQSRQRACDNWIDSSRFSMQLPDSFTRSGEMNTWLHFSSPWSPLASSGHSELSSVSPSSPTVAWMVQRWRVTACAMADISSHSRLRSASTALLEVPRSKHSSIGNRAFPVAAAKAWNCLPLSITSSPSLPQFRRALRRNCSDDRYRRRTSLKAERHE